VTSGPWLFIVIAPLWVAGAASLLAALKREAAAIDRAVLVAGAAILLIGPAAAAFTRSFRFALLSLLYAPLAVAVAYLLMRALTPSRGRFPGYYIAIGAPLLVITGIPAMAAMLLSSMFSGNPGH
jgi:hypothetical protein